MKICDSCAETGEEKPATTRSVNPDYSGYALCGECAAEYDSRPAGARTEKKMYARCNPGESVFEAAHRVYGPDATVVVRSIGQPSPRLPADLAGREALGTVTVRAGESFLVIKK